MKKLSVFVLIITAVAGNVIAQDLRLRPELATGLALYMPDNQGTTDDERKTTITLWEPTDGAAARFKLRGSYTNAQGKAGINFQMRANAPFNGGVGAYLDSCRLWFKLLNNKATILAGMLDDNGNMDIGQDIAEGLGVFVRLEPIANLTLGMSILPNATDQKNITNEMLDYAHYRYGARYAFPSICTITAVFADNAKTRAYDKHRQYLSGELEFLLLRKYGIQNIKLSADFDDMQDDNYKNLHIGQSFNLRIPGNSNFEIGFGFKQSNILGDGADFLGYSPNLYYGGHVYYQLLGGSIVPRIEWGYNKGRGGDPLMRTDIGESIIKSSVNPTAAAPVSGYKQDAANLSILPQIAFRLGRSSNYMITIGGGLLSDLTVEHERNNGMFFVEFRVRG